MSDFQGMEDLLQDFLIEANDLLSSVDNKLVDLERTPQDHGLLNDIFRGFHTIKGGAGFLNATELVTLCHLTENLFDRLRNAELMVTREIMDAIMDATASVRQMFGSLEHGQQPGRASEALLATLKQAIAGELSQGGGVVSSQHRRLLLQKLLRCHPRQTLLRVAILTGAICLPRLQIPPLQRLRPQTLYRQPLLLLPHRILTRLFQPRPHCLRRRLPPRQPLLILLRKVGHLNRSSSKR